MKKNPDCTVRRSAAPLPNGSGKPSWLHQWCRGLLPHEWFFTVFHYHYFADAVAGFVLAGASLFLATRWPVATIGPT
jgi:hypothetical protein